MFHIQHEEQASGMTVLDFPPHSIVSEHRPENGLAVNVVQLT